MRSYNLSTTKNKLRAKLKETQLINLSRNVIILRNNLIYTN